MRFINMSLRGLRRRPLRSALTLAGVAIAVGSFIALVGLAQGLEKSWMQGLTNRGIHLLGVRKGAVEIMNSTMEEGLPAKALQIPGVAAVAGELFDLIKLPGGVVGASGWPEGAFLWQSLSYTQGGPPLGNQEGAVLGQRLAERMHLKLGDRIVLQNGELKVTGIVRQGSVFNDNVMVVGLATLQRLQRKLGMVTVINLRLAHPGQPGEVAAVLAALSKALPEVSFYETKDAADANNAIQLMRQFNWSLSLIALIMAVFFIANTLLMSVTESTREIGILGALGWGSSRVVAKVVIEGLLLSTGGGVCGLVLGVLGLDLLSSLPRLAGLIDSTPAPGFLALVMVSTLALGVLGSAYPAWLATRLNPVDALRHE